MRDHHAAKFFETLFWIGAFLILLSFFNPRWFIITITVGIILMIMATVREGFKLQRAKTLVGVIRKNEPKIIHRIIVLICAVIVFIYLLFKRTLVEDVFLQLQDLAYSIRISWWVFVLIGVIIGLFILFSISRAGEVEYEKGLSWIKSKPFRFKKKEKPKKEEKKKKTKKQPVAKKIAIERKPSFFARLLQVWKNFWKKLFKPRKVKKLEEKKPKPEKKKEEIPRESLVIEGKPGFFGRIFWEEESFWRKIFKPFFERLEKKKAKRLKEKTLSKEEIRKRKLEALKRKAKMALAKEEIKHPLMPRILITLFIFAITIVLILHRKGKFSIDNPIASATLGLIVGLFALYIMANVYKVRTEKKIKKEKKEKELLRIIRKEVVARASKYETDFDRLYRLINEVGSLTVTEVAEGFGISKDQAEEWGKILESHDLIDLRYPAMGELLLCKKKSKDTK